MNRSIIIIFIWASTRGSADRRIRECATLQAIGTPSNPTWIGGRTAAGGGTFRIADAKRQESILSLSDIIPSEKPCFLVKIAFPSPQVDITIIDSSKITEDTYPNIQS